MAHTRHSHRHHHTKLVREAPVQRVSARLPGGPSNARWVMSPAVIEHERDIIRRKFLPDIKRRKLSIDLTAAPIKVPTSQIVHNETEIKKRWYKSPAALEGHNRRVTELEGLFRRHEPLPPVMARVLGPGRYRIWDGNHRLIASKRAGVPYVYLFPVLGTKGSGTTAKDEDTLHYKGILYTVVPKAPHK